MYHIARNFHRTLFSEISETSGIFQKNFTKWCFKIFQACSKEEKITENFENTFLKYSLKRIFPKFKLTKISGYTVFDKTCTHTYMWLYK